MLDVGVDVKRSANVGVDGSAAFPTAGAAVTFLPGMRTAPFRELAPEFGSAIAMPWSSLWSLDPPNDAVAASLGAANVLKRFAIVFVRFTADNL